MELSALRVGDLVTHAYKSMDHEYSLGIVISTETSIGLVKVSWASGRKRLHASYMLKRLS